ncbi:MAG: hypothetical protein ACD_79C00988G0010 [uncultured bacterium]|nr:MAG: hypothetical protein ACD_79C00988G0010 [uncultured bacterium]
MKIRCTIPGGILVNKNTLQTFSEEYKKYRQHKDRYINSPFTHPLTGDSLAAEPYWELPVFTESIKHV